MSRPHPAFRHVSLRDCALVVGVPLTREQFLEDLSKPDSKDFASHFRRKNFRANASEEFYLDLFELSARVARRVCDEVEAMGVTVKRAADLSDLNAMLRNFQCVTLVAHWRFVQVRPEDIIDVRGLWRALAAPEGRGQSAVAHAVSLKDPTLLAPETAAPEQEQTLRELLAKALDSIAKDSHALYKARGGASPAEVLSPDGVLERLTRVEIEQSFPGLILPGKSVEFSDEMHSVQEVVSATPEGFQGMLDLTSCNSVILAKEIKSRHPDCIIAANRYETPLHVCMSIYKLVIQLLASNAMSYADALSKFH